MRSGKFGRGRGDLGHDPLRHLVAQPALASRGRRSGGRRRSCWRRASRRGRASGSSSEGICRLKLGDAGTSPRTHPSKSCCICSAVPKNVTLRPSVGVVQRLVGAAVLGQPAAGRSGPGSRRPGGRWRRRGGRRPRAGCRASSSWVKVVVGSRLDTTTGAVTTSPSPSSTPVTAPPSTTMRVTLAWRRSSPPCCSNSRARWSAMVPEAAAHLRHGGRPRRGQREGEAEGAPGREGAPEGRVDGEEGQHAAHRCVLRPVGQEAVDDIHHAAEHGGADRLALRLVGGAGPHLVERLRRRAHVEAADGAGRCLGPRRHLGHAEHRLDPDRLAEVLQEPLGIRVEEDRRLAVLADAGGLDLGLVDRAGASSRSSKIWFGHRELDGPGQLEAVATDELGGRGHAADEVVLLQAQHPQAAPGHDRGGGQAVVARSDDNGVVVGHWIGTVATSPPSVRPGSRRARVIRAVTVWQCSLTGQKEGP